jgi:hypothetical protein
VIYADSDELLVPDPRIYSGLQDFCNRMSGPCVTAIGLNIVHDIEQEELIDATKPILRQRSFAQFVSPMCKTLIIKAPIKWGAGFHASTFAPQFSDLYLLHLRWIDLVECLRRLRISRAVEFDGGDGPAHHHSTYTHFISNFQNIARARRDDNFEFSTYLSRVEAIIKNAGDIYYFDGDIRSNALHRLPEEFCAIV